jgi:uncharacterized protein (DUF58 family)
MAMRAGPVQTVRRWWLARHAPSATLTLHHRNLYILPTRMGWMLGATLLLLLVASINDQLNLGYMLTFWLLGMAVVGMHLTHGNARGLQWTAPAHILHGHAGDALPVPLQVHNPRRRGAWAIGLTWHGGALLWHDLAPGTQALSLPWTAARRGRHALPTLKLETRYPLGAFRAWTWWRMPTEALVYPAVEADAPPWPSSRTKGTDTEGDAPTAQDEAGLRDQLRPFRQGDTPRDIAWKKSASALSLGPAHWISRERDAAPRGRLLLEPAMTGLADSEAALSRLCAWVLRADALGIDYGLRLGAHTLAPSHGEAHRQACLEALALC